MANPNPYTPSYSFSNWQAANPAKPLPAPQIDNELANVSTSLNAAITALNQIRRSDGKLVNGIVTFDSLNNDLKAGYSGGAVSAWAPVVDFAAGINASPIAPATMVVYQGETYVCAVAHLTTSLFVPGNWTKIAARGINGTGSGDMLAALNLSDLANKPQSRVNLGLGNVDNTHDVDKPISTATQAAIDVTNQAVAALQAAQFDYFIDCVPAYVSATSISFSAGVGFFGGKRLVLPALTKLLNATFVAGTGAGGLDAGTLQASKTYFLHAIRNVTTGNGDYIISLSLLAPTVPVGWELLSGSRVGIIVTNASAQVVPFWQIGNEVNTDSYSWFQANVTVSGLAVPVFTPIGVSTDIKIILQSTVAAPSQSCSGSISDAVAVNAVTATPASVATRAVTGSDFPDQSSSAGKARSNSSGQLFRSVVVASTACAINAYVCGWHDWQCRRLFA
ncbi:hypothetical protein [Rhizobium sp. WYJ-E13]|uniref:hypothetical protein n=1 Tax=Rhizobium sp. WYJ-E13 TaxID=2849093 RepID=UPI001C1EF75F|nr:hypothetical protein [Rhizobium sp. WYJ-E13]QWW67961.1 hypothetical protein KQ933_20645 [Rhizobium sp. WYJ-E13]